MTPVKCESFNNNNVSSASEYPEYPKYQTQYSGQSLEAMSYLPPMHGSDGGWSEGDESRGAVLPTQLYMGPEEYTGTFSNSEGHLGYYDTDLYDSHQDYNSEPCSSPQSNKRKGKGGRKKNLLPPTPAIMKHRRGMANARERKRMNGLNDAFERLREVVPNVNSEQKMSKMETLLVAQTYIKALAKLMETAVQEEIDCISQ